MTWKDVLKEDEGLLSPTYTKGKNSYPTLIKKLEKLIGDWKPEEEEGKAYLDDLIKVVSNSCPEGTKWCDECKMCETPEEKTEKHGGGEE